MVVLSKCHFDPTSSRNSHNALYTDFLFLRTSELGTLPLISTLQIISVTSSLIMNGSNIACMESLSVALVMSTTVYIIALMVD